MTDARTDRVPAHWAGRLERQVRRHLNPRLQGRGWRPRVVPFVGYGGAGWIRVGARVLLVPPSSTHSEPHDHRGWRRFVTASVPGVPVTVEIGGETRVVPSGPDGYVDVRVPCDLEPGWRRARIRVGDEPPVDAPVRVVGPGTATGLVSDIDDTVMETMVPRPLIAFRNAFLSRESARKPVPGMSELCADIVASHPDVFVVYLSTGAWNVALPLQAFLARNRFPKGPLLLTDWGPTDSGFFRSGRDHKRNQLERLFRELPQLRWILLGDDGQHDPQVYAEAAREHPDRVVAVAIRQLSAVQHLAVHGTPTAPGGEPAPEGEVSAVTVAGPDGFELREGLRESGIITPGA